MKRVPVCSSPGQVLPNPKVLRLVQLRHRHGAQIALRQDQPMTPPSEDTQVRLRPEGVVFAVENAATNDTSFPVGKFHRTRDATIMIERRRSDLDD
jgi:hypothetical protein